MFTKYSVCTLTKSSVSHSSGHSQLITLYHCCSDRQNKPFGLHTGCGDSIWIFVIFNLVICECECLPILYKNGMHLQAFKAASIRQVILHKRFE